MLFDFYQKGFVFGSLSELNVFIRHCVSIVENYLGFLSYKGKLFVPMDLSLYDAAIDITAELFRYENDVLVRFKSFFDKIEEKPVTEDDFNAILKSFLFASARRNLISIYKDSDPFTAKIIRNLNLGLDKSDYFITEMFSDRYIHLNEIDFSEKEYCGRDELLKIAGRNYDKINLKNTGTYLRSLLDVIAMQEEYAAAVAFNDIVFLYKYLVTENNNYINKNIFAAEPESGLHYKFLTEEIRRGFSIKLKRYFLKKNYSENEQDCMYKAIDEYLNGILNGGMNKGASELTREFFPDGDFLKNRNRVEYCIEMLIGEMAALITKGEL